MRLAKTILVILFLCASSAVFSQYPVSSDVYKQIETKFLDNGVLSKSKVDVYKKNLKKLQIEVEVNIVNIQTDQAYLFAKKPQ